MKFFWRGGALPKDQSIYGNTDLDPYPAVLLSPDKDAEFYCPVWLICLSLKDFSS